MKRSSARAGYLCAGLAVVLTMAAAAAVEAQGTGGSPSPARDAVVQHKSRFGFGAGQSLTVRATYHDVGGTTVRFNRAYRGLPVVNGDFIVHLDRAGRYRYAEGLRLAAMPRSTTPLVSASAAETSAVAGVSYPAAARSATLVVYGGVHASPLAWQVSTGDTSGLHGDATFVSATSGRVLASWPTVLNDNASTTPYAGANDTGKGKTLYSGQVSLKDVKRGFVTHYVLKDRSRGVQRIFDAHNGDINDGTLFKDANNTWGDGTETSRETAGADAAYGLANTWDFYLKTFGRSGIGDDGVAASAYVHIGNDYVNASWSDACFCMRFGDGSQASGLGPLVSLDVGGHEMSHGVTSRTAGLIYDNESGGLNESTSDVMGTMVEFYADNATDVPDYVLGSELFRDYDPDVNFVRRMDEPSRDGGSADCWYGGVGDLDPHASSGVGNHLFYLLSEGSGAKTINGIKYNSPTCNDKVVKGIGNDKAVAIWYRALTQHWVRTTTYHQARAGMLQAATELYGSGSTEYKATNAAWAAVNVS